MLLDNTGGIGGQEHSSSSSTIADSVVQSSNSNPDTPLSSANDRNGHTAEQNPANAIDLEDANNVQLVQSDEPLPPWGNPGMSERRREKLSPDVDRSTWDVHRWKDYNDFRTFIRARMRRYPFGVLGKDFRALPGFKGKKQRDRMQLLGFKSFWALLHSMPDLIVLKERRHPVSPLFWVYAPARPPLELPPARLPVPAEVLQRARWPMASLFEGPAFMNPAQFPELDHIPFPVPDYAVIRPKKDRIIRKGRRLLKIKAPNRPTLALRPGFTALRQIIRETLERHPEGFLLIESALHSGLYTKTGASFVRQLTTGKNYGWRDVLLGMPDLLYLVGRKNDTWVYPHPEALRPRPQPALAAAPEAAEGASPEDRELSTADAARRDAADAAGAAPEPNTSSVPGLESDDKVTAGGGASAAAAPPSAELQGQSGSPEATPEASISTSTPSPWAELPGVPLSAADAKVYDWEEVHDPVEWTPPPPVPPEWRDFEMPPPGPLPGLSYLWRPLQKVTFTFMRDLIHRYLQMNQSGLPSRVLPVLPGLDGKYCRKMMVYLGYKDIWSLIQAIPEVATVSNPEELPHNWILVPTHPIPGLPPHAVKPPPTLAPWETHLNPGKLPKKRKVPFTWYHPKGFRHVEPPAPPETRRPPAPAKAPIQFYAPETRQDRSEWEVDVSRTERGLPDAAWDRDQWELSWAREQFNRRREALQAKEEGDEGPEDAAPRGGEFRVEEVDVESDDENTEWYKPRAAAGPPPKFPNLPPKPPGRGAAAAVQPGGPARRRIFLEDEDAFTGNPNELWGAPTAAAAPPKTAAAPPKTAAPPTAPLTSAGEGAPERHMAPSPTAAAPTTPAPPPPPLPSPPQAPAPVAPPRTRTARLPFAAQSRMLAATVVPPAVPPVAAPAPGTDAPPRRWRQRGAGWQDLIVGGAPGGGGGWAAAAEGTPSQGAEWHTAPSTAPGPSAPEPWAQGEAPADAWGRRSSPVRGWSPATDWASAEAWGAAAAPSSPAISSWSSSAPAPSPDWRSAEAGAWGPSEGTAAGDDGDRTPSQQSVPAEDGDPAAAFAHLDVPWRRPIRYQRWDRPPPLAPTRRADRSDWTPKMPGASNTLLPCHCSCHGGTRAPHSAHPKAMARSPAGASLAVTGGCTIA